MNKSIKRGAIVRWLLNQKVHFYFRQETYSDDKLIPIWEAEWGGKIFCSHGTKPKEGVVILLNPKCDVKVEKCEKGSQGRFISLDAKINDTKVVLMDIYAPGNAQLIEFFGRIK